MAKKNNRNNAGRKLFDGKDAKLVVAKLERMFAAGATDEESCLYAGISRSALDRYVDDHPKFRDRKELLKHSPALKARINLNRFLGNCIDTDKWYLERRDPALSRQLKLGGPDGGSIKIEDPAANAWAEKILQALIDQQSPIRAKVTSDKKAGRK